MPKKQISTPQPVPTNVICSICDEPWSLHQPDESGEVSTLECVRLLKQKRFSLSQTIVRPLPYPVYARPWWQVQYTWTCGNVSQPDGNQYTVNTGGNYTNTATPTVALASAAA